MILVIQAVFMALLLLCGYLMLPLILAVLAPLVGLTILVGLIWVVLKIIQDERNSPGRDS